MDKSATEANCARIPLPKCALRRMLSCFWHLGFRLGWKYWKIEQSAFDDPKLILDWANRCRRAAIAMKDPERSAFISWAEALEKNLADWRAYTQECFDNRALCKPSPESSDSTKGEV